MALFPISRPPNVIWFFWVWDVANCHDSGVPHRAAWDIREVVRPPRRPRRLRSRRRRARRVGKPHSILHGHLSSGGQTWPSLSFGPYLGGVARLPAEARCNLPRSASAGVGFPKDSLRSSFLLKHVPVQGCRDPRTLLYLGKTEKAPGFLGSLGWRRSMLLENAPVRLHPPSPGPPL